MLWDSISNAIYISGNFIKQYNDTNADVVIEYTNDTFKTILSLPSYSFNFASMAIYKGNLFLGGTSDQTNLYYYNGTIWASVPQSPNNEVTCLFPYKDRLYVSGLFSMIGNMPCNNIAYLDSTGWHRLDQGICPANSFGLGSYRGGSMAFFRDTLYMTGYIIDSCNASMFQLVRYNGSYWEPAPGWQVGYNSNLGSLSVFQDKLYVGGFFLASDGVSLGNNIVYYDGASWHSPGAGTDNTVDVLTVANNKLYASGTFDWVDGMNIQSIASWDGHQWCSIDSEKIDAFNGYTFTIAQGDTTLYIYGGFTNIGSDTSFYDFAVWDGGSYPYQCGTYYTEVNNVSNGDLGLKVYPNPSSVSFIIDMTGYSGGEKQISIYDQLGQIVYQTQSTKDKLQVSDKLSSGIYTVSVTQDSRREYARIVVE
jgi:hypothetical protein